MMEARWGHRAPPGGAPPSGGPTRRSRQDAGRDFITGGGGGLEFHHALLLVEADARVAAAGHVGAEHGHELVGLAGHEEGVAKLERMLGVDVVVGEAVDEEERAFQLGGVGEDAADFVGRGVGLRETDVTLSVERVVVFPRDDGGAGDAAGEHVGTANGASRQSSRRRTNR